MGQALAVAALQEGHEVVVVSGPVELEYPKGAKVVPVISTEEMLEACMAEFPACDGLIGVAAPCDYRPIRVSSQKIAKDGQPLGLQLIETPDVVATLGAMRRSQWMVAFAVETQDVRIRALQKLERKNCDLIVLNGPAAIQASDTRVEVIDRFGTTVAQLSGSKLAVGREIVRLIRQQLICPAIRI